VLKVWTKYKTILWDARRWARSSAYRDLPHPLSCHTCYDSVTLQHVLLVTGVCHAVSKAEIITIVGTVRKVGGIGTSIFTTMWNAVIPLTADAA